MTLHLDVRDGRFNGDRVLHLDIKPRKGADGKMFRPVSSEQLHPVIAKQYGAVRGVTVHCTDVIGDAAALARRTATTSDRKSSYHLLIARDGMLYQLAPINWILWHAGRSLRTPKRTGYLDVWEENFKHRSTIETVVDIENPDAGYDKQGYPGAVAKPGSVKGKWMWPVVDGVVVGNPNNWGPGIEIMGKPGRPTSAQEDVLAEILVQLYERTQVTPDTVWPHGRGKTLGIGVPGLDPLHRTDPGFDVPAFALACRQSAADARETDGWDASGEDDPVDPTSGPAPHG